MESRNFDPLYAVVVWYNPNEKEVAAIELYCHDVERVIVVDNSTDDHSALLAGISNAKYIGNHSNLGIATALNQGCQEAYKAGATWVLTMDQDSRFDQQSLTTYLAEAQQYSDFSHTGIFSPFHDCDGMPERHHRHGRYEQMARVMCSGNLLRLEAWHQAGGFRDDFFIDCVDNEICSHLRQLGYQVVRCNQVLLTHSLGDKLKYIGFGKKKTYIPHAPWRYYYIGRNMRRMMTLYPDERAYYRKEARKYIKRLCLYDWEHKASKLWQFFRGWLCRG